MHEPLALRTLDAIHLAAALSLGGDLGAMAAYDTGLAGAAAGCGMNVIAPGHRRRGQASPSGPAVPACRAAA